MNSEHRTLIQMCRKRKTIMCYPYMNKCFSLATLLTLLTCIIIHHSFCMRSFCASTIYHLPKMIFSAIFAEIFRKRSLQSCIQHQFKFPDFCFLSFTHFGTIPKPISLHNCHPSNIPVMM